MPQTKVATCSYCGTRAALVLRGTDRHELSCSACGAPLHDLKMLKADHPNRSAAERPFKGKTRKPRHPHRDNRKKDKRRRRSGFGYWLAEELFDVVEDIFD